MKWNPPMPEKNTHPPEVDRAAGDRALCLLGAILLAGMLVIGFGGPAAATLPLPRATPPTTLAIRINHAPASLIQLLPDIGPTLSGRIVEARRELGPFLAAEDLLKVSGIGPKTLAGIKPFLTFEP